MILLLELGCVVVLAVRLRGRWRVDRAGNVVVAVTAFERSNVCAMSKEASSTRATMRKPWVYESKSHLHFVVATKPRFGLVT